MITITLTTEQLVGLIFAVILAIVGGVLIFFCFIKDNLDDDIDVCFWLFASILYTVGIALASGIIF